jgi:hypothetical protein
MIVAVENILVVFFGALVKMEKTFFPSGTIDQDFLWSGRFGLFRESFLGQGVCEGWSGEGGGWRLTGSGFKCSRARI